MSAEWDEIVCGPECPVCQDCDHYNGTAGSRMGNDPPCASFDTPDEAVAMFKNPPTDPFEANGAYGRCPRCKTVKMWDSNSRVRDSGKRYCIPCNDALDTATRKRRATYRSPESVSRRKEKKAKAAEIRLAMYREAIAFADIMMNGKDDC